MQKRGLFVVSVLMSTARRVHRLLPEVNIIVLLRNPRDRACSHYMHEIRNGTESLSFEEAIEAEEDRLRGEEDKIRNGVNYYSYNHVKCSYLDRGRYAEQLERQLAVSRKSSSSSFKMKSCSNVPTKRCG